MEKFDYSKTPGKLRKRYYSPERQTALVSIITPYYNAGKYFEETFNSVMNQTFPWFEWIIVNDGSTNEEDVKLLEGFSKKDARIAVVHQENGGLSCARNTGFRNASTDLVVPLDADDVISPQYIECLYWSLLYNPDAAWSYSNSYGFQEQEYIWKPSWSAERMKTENLLVATAMIRKRDYEEIGGYKIEKYTYNEDWRFWLDMLGKKKKPVHVASELFWYRRTDKGMLSSIKQDPEKEEFSKRIIKEAAIHVDATVQAVEYPIKKSRYSFYKPQFKKWDKLSNPDKTGKRILWMIPWMVMGGADKFNLDAISGLTAKGYENCILTTLPSENDWRQRFEEYTDEIFCMSDFLDPAHYLEFVSYYIQSRQIDVLIVTNAYDGYYMMPWLRQYFPELVIIDYVHMEEWYWRAGGHARPSGAMNGISEMTYVCNSATRQVMIEYFGCMPERVKCMYIGVDSHYYCRELEKPGYLHKMLGLSDERSIILFPCRIHEQKRPFMIMDIADEVIKKVPEAAFVVVGDGPQLNELKDAIKDRKLTNYIFCIGRSDQMRACYRDSKMTLICSLKEGLALTAYESCSMGIPVISSDVGGQRDLVDSDVGALVPLQQCEEKDLNVRSFPPQEVAEYAENIVRILKNPEVAAKMGKNGRQKVEESFSLEKMVQYFDSELEILLSDLERKKARVCLSESLQNVPGYAADYYSIYCQWKRQEQECEEVWIARCWAQERLEKLYSKKDSKLMIVYNKLINFPLVGSLIQKAAHVIWNLAGKFR